MSDINRLELFGKLGATLYRTLEGATSYCRLRGHAQVELAHWLHQILHTRDSDLHAIIAHFGLDAGRVDMDIQSRLARLASGADSVSDLSGQIDEAVERAWLFCSVKYGSARIRSAHLLAAMLKTASLRNSLYDLSAEFRRIVPDVMIQSLGDITQGSVERADDWAAGATAIADSPVAAADGQGVLDRYAVDLTARARAGDIDPVTGRDQEIRRMIDILMRRRQNNPLLTGEAGVGKTAVVEGLALRLARGDVPPALREVTLYMLDLGLLQAGAGMKGEFEQRLRQVIDAVTASERPAVLFIDEIHTLVGAGGAAGTGDAANLLKPALARGQLRTIGATTWAEYKKYIETDPALTRRFQVIQVNEPSQEQAIAMTRGLASALERHHGVLLLDEAIEACVHLSHRYIPARQLPDKAVALLDTACARVAISQHATPGQIEDARSRIAALEIEREGLAREAQLGMDREGRLKACAQQLADAQLLLAKLENRWSAEQALAGRVSALRTALQAPAATAVNEDQEALSALRDAQSELASLQEEAQLVFPSVDAAAVAAVVSEWTGIPIGRMLRDEANAILGLVDTLERRVVGQRHALEAIARRIQTSRARLSDPNKPVGVFLLCGPSGVGKTETALALADTLYGGEHNVITINMSEFQESHTVSTLKGAPPGYVGYGEGGVLTEAVRRRPYSVVLLDEVEKAHPDVHEIFFQVFDKGWMEDGEGRRIDFRNTVIILTSNAGSAQIEALCRGSEAPPVEQIDHVSRQALLRIFPPALLGRLLVVPYHPLSDAMLGRIVLFQLERIRERLREHHGIRLDVSQCAVDLIVRRCTEVESGGRMIDAILGNAVLPNISREVLNGTLQGRLPAAISLSADEDAFVFAFEDDD
jgi:type VI secretion system protein VasG